MDDRELAALREAFANVPMASGGKRIFSPELVGQALDLLDRRQIKVRKLAELLDVREAQLHRWWRLRKQGLPTHARVGGKPIPSASVPAAPQNGAGNLPLRSQRQISAPRALVATGFACPHCGQPVTVPDPR